MNCDKYFQELLFYNRWIWYKQQFKSPIFHDTLENQITNYFRLEISHAVFLYGQELQNYAVICTRTLILRSPRYKWMNWIQSLSATIRVKGLCTERFLILVSPKYKLYQIRCIIQRHNSVTQNDSYTCVCTLQLEN